MVAPTHHPDTKKLQGQLLNGHKNWTGATLLKEAYKHDNCDMVGVGMGGLQQRSRLGQLPKDFMQRLAAALIAQEIIPQRGSNGPAPIKFRKNKGRLHPFAESVVNKMSEAWFTINEQNERHIDEYMKFRGAVHAREWFILKEDTPAPEAKVIEASSREITPFSELDGSYSFLGSLRGASWAGLHPPTEVIPGNLVPGTLLSRASAGMNLNAGTTPITMLGEGCGAEAEQYTRKVERELETLRGLNSGPLPDGASKLTKNALLDIIKAQNVASRRVDDAIGRLLNEIRVDDRRRFERWQSLFRQVGEDQAENPRPGLWSPARDLQPNELHQLNTDIQDMVRPESIYRPKPPSPVIPPSSSHNWPSRQGQTGGGLWQPHMPGASFAHHQLPSSSSYGQLPGIHSGSQLPISSSRGSGIQQRQHSRELRDEHLGVVAPTGRRHVQGPRTLAGAASQPPTNWNAEDDEEDDMSYSQPQLALSARRKRESQSASGRQAKSPSTVDPRRTSIYQWGL